MQGLHDFGAHTRHTPEEAAQLPAKWLACSFAPHAYPHVANDYEWVQLRTHDPPLESYHTERLPDAATFVPLMRESWDPKVALASPATPKLGAFADSLFHETAPQNDWRARAAFFIAHRMNHKGARALLGAVLRNGEPETGGMQRVAEQELWARMQAYVKEVPASTTSTAEWGAILNGMVNAPKLKAPKSQESAALPAPVATEAFPDSLFGPQRVAVKIAPTPLAPTKTHAEWAQREEVQAWRRAALMSPAADPSVITHAFVRAALKGEDESAREVATELLADYASPEQAQLLAEKLPHLGAEREYEPAEVVREAVKCGVYF